MRSKELRENRATIYQDMQKVVLKAKGENRSLNSEEQEQFDRLDTECNKLLVEAEGFERIEKFERSQLETLERKPDHKNTNSLSELKHQDYDKAVRGWMCSKFQDRDVAKFANDYKSSAERVGIDYNRDRISLQFADQSSIVAGLGKEFVPQATLANYIYRELESVSNIRSIAQVINTPTGAPFVIPVSLDVAESVLIAQNATDSQNDIPTAAKTISSFCYTSQRVNVSVELLRDSAFPVEQFVGSEFGRRHERGTSRAFANGAGTTEPQGYTNCTVGTTVYADVCPGYAQMQDLIDSVPLAYQEASSFAIRVSPSVMSCLRREVDGDSRPLWQPSLTEGNPDRYLGKPIYVDPYLGDLGDSDNVVAVAGDWSRFLIRQIGSVELWQQQVIDNRQIALVSFLFVDSQLLSSTALKSMTIG